MPVVVFDIEIDVRGPVLTRATAPGGYGIDLPVARAPQFDRPPGERDLILAGSHVTGKLREAWEDLGELTGDGAVPSANAWLGEESAGDDGSGGATASFEPKRKRLFIEDLRCQPKGRRSPAPETTEAAETRGETDRRTRLAIDPETGTAQEGALFIAEMPVPPGATATFTGTARALLTAADDPQALETGLRAGLRWVGQVGGQRSVGSGRVVGVRVVYRDAEKAATADGASTASAPRQSAGVAATPATAGEPTVETIGLVLRPLSPFCVVERRIDANSFDSSRIIPGSVIKGTLAAMLRAAGYEPGAESGDLAWFDMVRFGHAFPAPARPDPDAVPTSALTMRVDTRRPVRWPLSLVKVGDAVYDVALRPDAGLIDGRAPAFAIDWKDDSDIDDDFGWSRPRTELRVRTAIDPKNRRADEGKLFAYEMVVPDESVWLAPLGLADVPEADRPALVATLRAVAAGELVGLGKTKATVAVDWSIAGLPPSRPAPPDAATRPIDGRYWVITLQTPALMLDIDWFDETSGGDALRAAYAAYWNEIGGGALRLSHHFARQRLEGGVYLHGRFQRNRIDRYKPYPMTEAGSVFVLTASDGDAAAAQVGAWLARGLPLGDRLRQAHGLKNESDWRACPYIPTNRFGEIAVNLPVHRDRDPRALFEAVPTPGGGRS